MTTNDKTIKLFKLWDRGGGDGNLDVAVKQRKLFAGAHAYNINSVSFNSDGETFISTDDLRINLWYSSDSFRSVSLDQGFFVHCCC